MRTKEQWENHVYPKALEKLSPRLQMDLKRFDHKLEVLELDSYYFYGPTGTGKTTLMARLYIEAHRKKYFERLPGDILWTTFSDMLENIRKAMRQPVSLNIHEPNEPWVTTYKDEYAVMAEYQTAGQLFLDDIGDSKFTDWNLSQLQLLINYRYENLLPIVITSNLSLEELEEATGDSRISSRINRICLIKPVN